MPVSQVWSDSFLPVPKRSNEGQHEAGLMPGPVVPEELRGLVRYFLRVRAFLQAP